MKLARLQVGEKLCKFSHHYLHLTYLGLVFFESHGIYGIAAGMLGCVVLVEGAVAHKLHHRDKDNEHTD